MGIGGTTPTIQWFQRNGVRFHLIQVKIIQTCSSDGHLLEGVKLHMFLKLVTKYQASLFKEFDVEDAVLHQVALHIKDSLVSYLGVISSVELGLAHFEDDFMHVHVPWWHETHIVDISGVLKRCAPS